MWRYLIEVSQRFALSSNYPGQLSGPSGALITRSGVHPVQLTGGRPHQLPEPRGTNTNSEKYPYRLQKFSFKTPRGLIF
jgi:hypothetical protein